MIAIEIKKKILNGINRFLIESAPNWSQSDLENLIGSVENDDNQEALRPLEDDKVIKITNILIAIYSSQQSVFFGDCVDFTLKSTTPGFTQGLPAL